MRTIKTYSKGAPFYNAFLRTWLEFGWGVGKGPKAQIPLGLRQVSTLSPRGGGLGGGGWRGGGSSPKQRKIFVRRLTHGTRRLIPMIVFDSAELVGWQVGDLISTAGEIHPHREMQQKMGLPMSEDDYILTNERTGTTANVRKNDFEVEDAHGWLAQLVRDGKVK